MGVKTTKLIINKLNESFGSGEITKGQDLKEALQKYLIEAISLKQMNANNELFLLVGINGSGKTTFAAKLANQFISQGKKVLLVAGDTFRAAAVEQLADWAKKIGASIEIGKPEQDPSSVVFAGCQRYKNENFDILIIDTAGRLQTKVNLMKELEKIKKVIEKQLPEKKVLTLLTIDSMLGQNSFEQANLFNQSTNLDGLILTKMDGTGKAGIAFAIVQELKIPVKYICFGEKLEQISDFDAQSYVEQLLSEK